MLNLLWLVPFLPLGGCLVLVATEGKLPARWVPWIGAGSVGLAAIVTVLVGSAFLSGTSDATAFRQDLWTWIAVDDFSVHVAFYLDRLSLVMLGVVTGVGFLIHVYSAGYMAADPGYSRFFAYMNLFVFAMLILVLADNLALLYLGWEGVGLCSYLLIGFWYQKPENGYAARKAFIVTRVGDTALLLGLLLLFTQLGSLDIEVVLQRAVVQWPAGSALPLAAALLLLGGAVGKSAQLPLQVWLPDAMAGPTPVSALIHAATMVTAGVYLVARHEALFRLAPEAQLLVGVIGAASLLMAACSALVQTDIKRILAYSTISQIGYMFLGLGVGARSAAIFHLMTHAFFKALLFLAAGAVIVSLHHEQNIFRMGGLWRRLPVTFWTFLIGAAALVALPFTAGYYSKHDILLAAYASRPELWAAGAAGALLTALYTTRLLLVVFFGAASGHAREKLPWSMLLPLVLLAALSLAGGGLEMQLPQAGPKGAPEGVGMLIRWLTALAPFVGILAGFGFYGSRLMVPERLSGHPVLAALQRFWLSGWGMDWLYARLFVRPYTALAAVNKGDLLDAPFRGVAFVARAGHRALARTQTGKLRWYAAGMAGGVVLLIAVGLLP